MLTPGTFEKVLTDLISPNVSKNMVKKMPKIMFCLTLFGALPKIGDWI